MNTHKTIKPPNYILKGSLNLFNMTSHIKCNFLISPKRSLEALN